MNQKQKTSDITPWLQQYLREGEELLWHGRPRIRRYYMNYYRLRYVLWGYILVVFGLMSSDIVHGNFLETLIISLIMPAFIAIPLAFALLRNHFRENFTPEVASLLSALYCVTNQRVLIFSYDHNELIHKYAQEIMSIEVYYHQPDWGDIILENRQITQPPFPYQTPYHVAIGFKGIDRLTHVSNVIAETLGAEAIYYGDKRKQKTKEQSAT